MGFTRARTRLRKARSNPRQAFQRSWKAIAGTAVALLRPGLQRQRPGNIVMLHRGRCGSTVLGGMLNQHPRVFWDREVYHRSLKEPRTGEDPFRLLARRMPRAGSAYYGFEMKPIHLRMLQVGIQEFLRALDRLGFTHFIVLERKNYLRRFLSGMIARKSTVFHRAPGEPLSRTRVIIDVDQVGTTAVPLLDFLISYEEFYTSLRDALNGKRTLWLTFEDDILDDPVVAYHKTLEFLELHGAVAPEIWYGRTNPFRMQEIVSNFEDVESVLRGTRFEWMLYD